MGLLLAKFPDHPTKIMDSHEGSQGGPVVKAPNRSILSHLSLLAYLHTLSRVYRHLYKGITAIEHMPSQRHAVEWPIFFLGTIEGMKYELYTGCAILHPERNGASNEAR